MKSKFFHGAAMATLLASTAASPALAQNFFTAPTGYQPGDVLTHVSILGVIPENLASAVSKPDLPGFHVHASSSVSPEVDLSYFLTPNLSLELIAATTRHNVWVQNGSTKLKVGSVWVLPPTLTAQWHFPEFAGIRPYVGAGVTVAFFYGASPAHSSGFTATSYSTAVGPTVDAGFDVPISGNWSANFDVKQMFITTAAHVNHGAIHAITELDPTAVGVGVGYKW